WSWKIGEFAGIGVYMHATFLLLLGWVALVHWQDSQSFGAVVSGLVFILALFLCVVAHEYGHALTARRYGIKTREITLLPIGGVARLERMPDDPRQEMWVALAGPAVNVVIAGALLAWLVVTGGLVPLDQMAVGRGSLLERLMIVNLFLAAFNMLPAFPMDGGRVLRAVLAQRMEYTRATQIGAAQESTAVQMKSALGGIPVARAMLTDFRTLAPGDSLARAAELILAGSQHDFPVVDGGRVTGVLTRADLIGALSAQNTQRPVAEVMQREFQVADSSDMLEAAMERLQHEGRLVGLVTMDNIGEFVLIHAALTGKPAPRIPLSAEG
ncbi:MAG: site-2 protease family protein, partial [Vicinamibacterales bacterium]|nr:site-2 protease family protein [Vicinamibacterales bacterium]